MMSNKTSLFGLAAAASLGVYDGQTADQRPNIIFVMMDDMGIYDAGFLGRKYIETPNIDRLASEGIFFSNAYANSPECSPTRACIITGQYTPRHGIYHVPNKNILLPGSKFAKVNPVANRISIGNAWQFPQALKKAGYRTGFFGKWHHHPHPKAPSAVWDEAIPTYRNKETIDVDPKRAFTITKYGIDFMKKYKDNGPFFLYLAHHAPHWPFEFRPATYAKYKAKKKVIAKDRPDYAAMIEDADTTIGQLLAYLDESGLTKNTWLFFFSDNGGMMQFTSNGIYRGGKGRIYEGGIRVPLIVRAPGLANKGTVCSVPVISTDFAPTFLALAKTRAPEGVILDGRDLSPLLRGGRFEKRPIFWHCPTYNTFQVPPYSAMRLGKYKLILWYETGSYELFDLENDPGERRNLSKKMPERVQELSKILSDWQKSVKAPAPTPNPNYDPTAVRVKRR